MSAMWDEGKRRVDFQDSEGAEGGKMSTCACLSEDAKTCLQLRGRLTDKQFDALDPDDQSCECVCHGDPYIDDFDDTRRFEG